MKIKAKEKKVIIPENFIKEDYWISRISCCRDKSSKGDFKFSLEVENNFIIIEAIFSTGIWYTNEEINLASPMLESNTEVWGALRRIDKSHDSKSYLNIDVFYQTNSNPHRDIKISELLNKTHVQKQKEYPHNCPLCNSPAYISPITGKIDCVGCDG